MAGRSNFGCAYVLLILFVPAVATSYFLDSPVWLLIIPPGIVVAFISFAVVAGFIFPKPKLTAEQFADALERHLLEKDDGDEWDNLSYGAVTEECLKQIQWELWRFDSLSTEADKEQLKSLIAAIRSGSLPEVVPPTQLTYRSR
jgi:hypothetical protein